MKKLDIKIEKYKSLESVKLSLNNNSNRLLALIGANNAGKTSILESINKLSGNPSFKKSEITKYSNLKNENFENNNSSSALVSLEFLFEEGEKQIPLITSIKEDKFTPTTFPKEWIQEKTKLTSNLFKQLEKTEYKKNGAWHNKENTFTDEYWYNAFKYSVLSTKDQKAISLIEKIKKEVEYLKMDNKINVKNINNFNIFKYSSLDLNILFEENLVDQTKLLMKESILIWEKILKINFKEYLDNKAKRDKREHLNFLKTFEKNANKILNDLSSFLINKNNEFKFEINIIEDVLIINFLPIETNKEKIIVWDENPENAGDGVQYFWSIIFRMQSISKSEPAIITIDEPEKHLNPLFQKHLLSYFKGISKNKKRMNQVIIYATHSPFMIDMDLYQNIHVLERSEKNNATLVKNVYDVKKRGVPNLLIDTSIQMSYIESVYQYAMPKNILFVEGITDFNALTKLLKNTFIIPLFGAVYKKMASINLPYIFANHKNFKILVDDDKQGNEIIDWFKTHTNIEEKNISKYSNYFSGKNLEETIIYPWFKKNNQFKITKNKKIDSIIFRDNVTTHRDYNELVKFIE